VLLEHALTALYTQELVSCRTLI